MTEKYIVNRPVYEPLREAGDTKIAQLYDLMNWMESVRELREPFIEADIRRMIRRAHKQPPDDLDEMTREYIDLFLEWELIALA